MVRVSCPRPHSSAKESIEMLSVLLDRATLSCAQNWRLNDQF